MVLAASRCPGQWSRHMVEWAEAKSTKLEAGYMQG